MNEHRKSSFINSFACIVAMHIVLLMVLISAGVSLAQNRGQDLILTALFDNRSSNTELKTGFGYSCLIQGPEKTILFDIGNSGAVKNMDKLNINPAAIDVLVISHDHFDHIGGFSAFSERNKHAKIYDVPDDSVKICKNVFTTGAMEARNRGLDALIKGTLENALIIRTAKGLVVMTGCAHPGIVEIVQRAKLMFPEEPVYLVMGGFHLLNESRERVKQIAADLKKENVLKVSPGHCTGRVAESVLAEVFGKNYLAGDVGKPIIIEGAFAN